MMNSFRSIVITALGFFCTSISNGEIGQMCQEKYDCHIDEICSDGFCNCTQLVYTSESVPYCETLFSEVLCRTDKPCMENGECIRSRCQCNEGYHRIGDSCLQVVVQGLLMTCGNIVDQKAEICDTSKHSLCQSKTCICSTGFVPDPSGQCEPIASYISRNNLTEYRVKPGSYCRNDGDCLEGLECYDLKCSCPSECGYDEKKEVCDCGEVDKGVAHIIVGVILGFLIIVFWCFTIRHTIKRHKHARRSRTPSEPSDDLDEPPSYSLFPMGPETTVTASAPSVGWSVDGSPTKQENLPSAPEFNENLPPKTYLPYPVNPAVVNPPTTSELGPPPPYSLLPAATDSPPTPPPAFHVSSPCETQPAYNPFYQGASNAGSAESDNKLNKQH